MKIGILGMGGIGSFIGAKLAQNYADDEETGTTFICRGQTKETIKKNGNRFGVNVDNYEEMYSS